MAEIRPVEPMKHKFDFQKKAALVAYSGQNDFVKITKQDAIAKNGFLENLLQLKTCWKELDGPNPGSSYGENWVKITCRWKNGSWIGDTRTDSFQWMASIQSRLIHGFQNSGC